MLILNGPLGVISTAAALTIGKIGLSPMTEIQIVYTGPIVNRADAKASGITHYFTGRPCKHGHIDQRQVCNWDCVECVRIRNSLWRHENPERIRELDIDWCNKNRKKKLNHCKTWRDSNPDKIRQYSLNAVARRKGADGFYTSLDIEEKIKIQDNKCAAIWCMVDLSMGYHVDHIMPLFLGGSNWPDNLQCLCRFCNLSKGSKHPHDWILKNA
jgi:5-methylcytosine-specific restriction endonuclease McrA